jgi:hypothetical protein
LGGGPDPVLLAGCGKVEPPGNAVNDNGVKFEREPGRFSAGPLFVAVARRGWCGADGQIARQAAINVEFRQPAIGLIADHR